MRHLALAMDYDGTLASEGAVRPQTWAALDRLRASGRRTVLVTGRELDDLRRVCGSLERFDRVVAENGAVLFRPGERSERALAAPPPARLLERLRERGVSPLKQGRVIVTTLQPHARAAQVVLLELGLRWQVVLNRDAVMLLPDGVDKQSGLSAALAELDLSLRDAAAVGDAENNRAMLAASGFGAAVANALPALARVADLRLRAPCGEGVEELIDLLLEQDQPRPRPALLVK